VEQEHVYSVAIDLLAIAASKRGDRDRAHALLEESLEIGRRGGEQWLHSIALNNLGDQLLGEGDYERAVGFFEFEAALGPELLASELAVGAALSLEDAIDLALGRAGNPIEP
jgi:tetratricopeptide (TPR) repeat protein